MKIILAGIGIKEGDISISAYKAATSGKKVYLRTALTKSAESLAELGINAEPLDRIYQKSRNFDTLSKNLAEVILSTAKTEEVVYLVDGDVLSDESCRIIINKRGGKDVEIISGVSRATAYLEKLGVQSNYCALSAYALNSAKISLPLIVTDIDNMFVASKVKLFLSEKYGDEIPCYKFINGNFKKIQLYEFDFDNDFDYSCALVILSLDFLHRERHDFDDLIEILRALRSENGCPWDKAQTKESIRINMIEEAYELVDAVTRGDDDDILEETGDVILQAAFQAIFAEERGAFNYGDVLSGICNKLISRHTHIFGADSANSADAALSVWDKNKQKEKGYASGAEYISSVPKNLPALLRAEKVGNRAKKYNLDFENVNQVFDKIYEECDELKEALALSDEDHIKEECGDLLFTAVNLLRKIGVEAEEALAQSTEKFIDRFKRAEMAAIKDGKNVKNLTPKEFDEYYNAVKKS